MEFLVVILIGGVVAIVAASLWARHREKIDRAWAGAAEKLGLHFESTKLLRRPQVLGNLDGIQVEVTTINRGGHNNSEIWTRYRLDYPHPLGLGLKLTREGTFAGLAKLFGSQDIEVGDPGFDAAMLVKGNVEKQVREWLTPARRLRIQRLFGAFEYAEVDDRGVNCRFRGTETDGDRLARRIRVLADAARNLSAIERETAVDLALEAQREGRLEEALEHLGQALRSSNGEDTDLRVVESQILDTAGRHEEAEQRLVEAAAQAPDDEELQVWSEPSAEPEPAEPEPAQGPTVEQVCRRLFGDGLASLKIKDRFTRELAGRTVEWTGTLRQADAYFVDLVFGPRPGTRLRVELAETDGTAFGRKVHAIVQLPPGLDSELRQRVGETVTFRGRLASCDALMRNLFVAEADLDP